MVLVWVCGHAAASLHAWLQSRLRTQPSQKSRLKTSFIFSRLRAKDVQLKDGIGPALVRAYEVGEGAGEEVGLGLGISYDPAHSAPHSATHSAPRT